MGTQAPERREMSLQALERANEIRLARAELKHRIASGEIFPASVLLNPPEEARNWAIGDLLMSQRRWGTITCRRFLRRNQVSEIKPVGALTVRQRRLLAEQLGRPRSR